MNKYKVIRTDRWYDPEGLNIEPNGDNVLFCGEENDCLNYLREKRAELVKENSDRDDISVSPITTNYELDRLEPLKTGGFTQIWSDKVKSVSFEVYFFSAISKNIYMVVKC